MTAAYADPWRPNYERRALILWVVVAVVACGHRGSVGPADGGLSLARLALRSPWR